jgi:hypothetical protein
MICLDSITGVVECPDHVCRTRGRGIKVERVQKCGVTKREALRCKVLVRAIAQAKKRYPELKNRYGARYTSAMVSAAFFTFFLPLPGSSLVGVALVVGIAELHRAIAQRSGFPQAITDLVVVVRANMLCWTTGRSPSPRG